MLCLAGPKNIHPTGAGCGCYGGGCAGGDACTTWSHQAGACCCNNMVSPLLLPQFAWTLQGCPHPQGHPVLSLMAVLSAEARVYLLASSSLCWERNAALQRLRPALPCTVPRGWPIMLCDCGGCATSAPTLFRMPALFTIGIRVVCPFLCPCQLSTGRVRDVLHPRLVCGGCRPTGHRGDGPCDGVCCGFFLHPFVGVQGCDVTCWACCTHPATPAPGVAFATGAHV